MPRNADKTECIHGHPFDERNTRITSRGQRDCRACALARDLRLAVDSRLPGTQTSAGSSTAARSGETRTQDRPSPREVSLGCRRALTTDRLGRWRSDQIWLSNARAPKHPARGCAAWSGCRACRAPMPPSGGRCPYGSRLIGLSRSTSPNLPAASRIGTLRCKAEIAVFMGIDHGR
jgi:hypothetical protein